MLEETPPALYVDARRLSTKGGLFHTKGTKRCAVFKGILFRTSCQAKGIVFFVALVHCSQGYHVGQYWPGVFKMKVLWRRVVIH